MSISSVADSVKQRLLNKARSDNRSFNELLQYYVMERFLYRLSVSPHASNYMLKGALLLKVWSSLESRSTMDIDMLGKAKNVDQVLRHVQDILQVKVEPDGLVFDRESLRAERITKHAGYNGVRVPFWGFLGKAQIRMQIDIGFGDVVYPEPKQEALPCMLDFPAPWLLCYSPESAIAEKFQAIIYLGSLNSRMKDFYDIWLLSRQFQFELYFWLPLLRVVLILCCGILSGEFGSMMGSR